MESRRSGLLVLLVAAGGLTACGRTSLSVPEDGGAPLDAPPSLDAGDADAGDAGCTTNASCDDGIFCNGFEVCIAGTCEAGTPVTCEDMVSCTVDACDETTEACTHAPDPTLCGDEELCDPMLGCVVVPCTTDTDCDDARVCDGVERCVGGTCRAGTAPDCDDGSDCTVDACLEGAGGCVRRPRDRDGDGFGDATCGGADCDDGRADVFPGAFEVCDDGADNDCDGAADCGDFDCSGTPVCRCEPVEDCSAARDADCDGLVGCMDPDCATLPMCATCMPTNLGSMVGPAVATGSTSGGPTMLVPPCSPGSTAPEAVFQWTAPSSGTYTFDTFGSGYDTILYLRGSCTGPDLSGACNDDTGGLQSRVTITAAAGRTIIIVVDGFGSSNGSYVLNITAGSTEICNNGADDDGDGDVDCADSDCASAPTCCTPRMEVCTNGTDDDCDSRVDCADPDCAGAPACCVPMPESCGNGRDDDCDTLTDCADPDCVASPACCVPSPETCSNGRDDDCDRRVDCADPDCAASPACCVPTPEVCDNGGDDDCDTLADCADPDCAGVPVCCVPAPESCSNGRDDDCDMLSDCADPDCASAPACAPCPDRDIGSRLGRGVATGTTTGAPNRFTPSCATSSAPDRAYRWTAPVSGDFLIDTFGSAFDTMLTLHASCSGPELPGMCNDDVPGAGRQSRLRVTLSAGDVVLIVVDGWGSSSGSFILNITRAFPDETGLCSDTLDNDGDLAIDCADSDCAMDTACAP